MSQKTILSKMLINTKKNNHPIQFYVQLGFLLVFTQLFTPGYTQISLSTTIDSQFILNPPLVTTQNSQATFKEDKDNFSIIELVGNYDKLLNGQPNFEPRSVVAREFFNHHADEYDFLAVFTSFQFNLNQAAAFHWGVQNNIKGIGLPLFDNSGEFGSAGKLQGYVDMGPLKNWQADPLNPEFQQVLSTLGHELLHQWGCYVHFQLPDGSLSDKLLGKDSSHWSYLLDSDGSVMYGSDWQDNQDGTYTATTTRKFYSPLDLYLMGMLSANEVTPFTLLENQAIDPTQLPEKNITITAQQHTVTIEDIIAAEGTRIPAATDAQKMFRIGFVLLTGQDEVVTDVQVAVLRDISTAFVQRFSSWTGGRGFVHIYPQSRPVAKPSSPEGIPGDGIRVEPSSLLDGFTWLRAQQYPSGYWQDKADTQLKDTAVALDTLTRFDLNFTTLETTILWLLQRSQNDVKNSDNLARLIIALEHYGQNVSDLQKTLLSLQNNDGGWGISAEFQSSVTDTALALQALITVADSHPQVIIAATQFLQSAQNMDGGWGNIKHNPSQIGVTVTVLAALKQLEQAPLMMANAIHWLTTKQDMAGGFGDTITTVHDTAQVLEIFSLLKVVDQIRATDAVQYLLSHQTKNGSWANSVWSTALTLFALKQFNFTNWHVNTLIANPVNPSDGQRVELALTVRNDSNLRAPASVLRIYDGDPKQGGIPIGNDFVIPELPSASETIVHSTWDTFGKAGLHTLIAVVDPDNLTPELTESDNSSSVAVAVVAPPTGIDLSISDADIDITPIAPTQLPTTLAITAIIRNMGLSDAHQVKIQLFTGDPGQETLLDHQVLDVASRASLPINFGYELQQIGATRFVIRIDPDNAIAEADETNNQASISLTTAIGVDLEVTAADITINPQTITVGKDVVFEVTLHNKGASATPDTQVTYSVGDNNNTTQSLITNTIQLEAGHSTTQHIPWRVNLLGDLTFTAQLDPNHLIPETNEDNNTATLNFVSAVATGANFVIEHQDISFSPDPGLDGHDVTIAASVRNTGVEAATNIEVAFYEGDPYNKGTQIGTTQIIPKLEINDTAQASVILPLHGKLDRIIFVVIDPNQRIGETNETDNVAFSVLPVVDLPDLAVSSSDIQLDPRFPTTGNTITLNARISNLGQQSASDVVIRLFEGDPATQGIPVGGDKKLSLQGSKAAVVSFSWKLMSDGSKPLVLQIDPDNTLLEQNENNNQASVAIQVQDNDFYVSQRYFSPNGDGVQDTTDFYFSLPLASQFTINIVNKRDEVVRQFTGEVTKTVEIVNWDGLTDFGSLVFDGRYRLIALANGVEYGEAITYVDTNRSSLLEAIDTSYGLFTNLTCEVDSFFNFVIPGEDELAYFSVSGDTQNRYLYSDGIYRVVTTSGIVETIIPKQWFNGKSISSLKVADDTSKIAFTTKKSGIEQLYVADGDGGNIQEIKLSPINPSYIHFPPQHNHLLVAVNNQLYKVSLDAVVPSIELIYTGVGKLSLTANQFSPQGNQVFIQEADLLLLDIETGITKIIVPSGYAFISGHTGGWSPDGSKFFVTASGSTGATIGIQLITNTGELLQDFSFQAKFLNCPGRGTRSYFISQAQWSGNNNEVTFVYTTDCIYHSQEANDLTPVAESLLDSTTEPLNKLLQSEEGIYIAHAITGELKRVAEFENNTNSYHISTWDGMAWVERGTLHYGLHYWEQSLNLSEYLPDPEGDYKVRIYQQGAEAAHIESVTLDSPGQQFEPTQAFNVDTGEDILPLVQYQDNNVADSYQTEIELHWVDVDAQDISLVLRAREETLSQRQSAPFRYPVDANEYYHYVLTTDAQPMQVDGIQQATDHLAKPLFQIISKPDTGHPFAPVMGYIQNDDQFLYAALDFTVDNTLDGEADWASLIVKTAQGQYEYKLTASHQQQGAVGFGTTAAVHHQHKYYEFKIPLADLHAGPGDTLDVSFYAYGTAAILESTDTLPYPGQLMWVPGERALFWGIGSKTWGILLDENDTKQLYFQDWNAKIEKMLFTPSDRLLTFQSQLQSLDPKSICYQKGTTDQWTFRSLLNLTADVRAIRSSKAGGVKIKGTAIDLNFQSYYLEYATANTPDFWQPIAPASGQAIIDGDMTTWIPPEPGTYLIRLTAMDLAGNQLHAITRVIWNESPSITDLYRSPAIFSPNGDGTLDEMLIHYRVLEPIHLEFNFYNQAGDRVRTIKRDHAVFGDSYEFSWDGRDDYGILVADGLYQMRVQDYEFLITVDNTPPKVALEIYDLYHADGNDPYAKDCAEKDPGMVAIASVLHWRITDANYHDASIERGQGENPLTWVEYEQNGQVQELILEEKGDGELNAICIRDANMITNSQFRLTAYDLAGNRGLIRTPLDKPQLMLSQFGQHALNKRIVETSEELTPELVSKLGGYFQALAPVPYRPLESETGKLPPMRVPLGPVRFRLVETVSNPLAQIFVQYRLHEKGDWQTANVNQIWTTDIIPSPVAALPNTIAAIQWDMAGLVSGVTYDIRLRAIDQLNQEFVSNPIAVLADDLLSFQGIIPSKSSNLYKQYIQPLLDESPQQAGETVLWGLESSNDAFEEITLWVRSDKDPRFSIARPIGRVLHPHEAFIFKTTELDSCTGYYGYLVGKMVPRLDPVSGRMVTLTRTTTEQPFALPCLEIEAAVIYPAPVSCNQLPPKQLTIRLQPRSLNGAKLKSLTLSKSSSGEFKDVVFNVNNPESTRQYDYELDTSSLAEGAYYYIAHLVDVTDFETSKILEVVVDHTPPTLAITYPEEGQRLCGKRVPVETFIQGNYDRHMLSPNMIFPLEGQIPQPYIIDDIRSEGDVTLSLQVFSKFGFHQCVKSSFFIDGKANMGALTLLPKLFSPNADGVFDETTASYSALENVHLDIDVYAGKSNPLQGEIIRHLEKQLPLLAGDDGSSIWDGTDNTGKVVPDGYYHIQLTVSDACGNQTKVPLGDIPQLIASKPPNDIPLSVEVDNTPPTIAITYPKPGDPIGMIIELQGTIYDLHLQNYQIDYVSDSAPNNWISITADTRNIEQDVLAHWNTFGLEPGTYTIRIRAKDTVGNEHEEQITIVLEERVRLITYLETVPKLFSPNNDNLLDQTAVRFGFDANVSATLAILDNNGELQRTLLDREVFAKGNTTLSWDGKNNSQGVVADGHYTVVLEAKLNGQEGVVQQEQTQVTVDTLAPTILIDRPRRYTASKSNIIASVEDSHLQNYSLALTSTPETPLWEVLAQGDSNQFNAVMGSLEGLEEQDYALQLTAIDQGHTKATREVLFTIDDTRPEVTLTAPQPNLIAGGHKNLVAVQGQIKEDHLDYYQVNFSPQNGEWQTLLTGNALPLPETVTLWDVSALTDGPYTLQLLAKDKADWLTTTEVPLIVDNTAPEVSITTPTIGSYIKTAIDISGTATDSHFAAYYLEVAPKNETQYTEIGSGQTQVNSNVLTNWLILPSDGSYQLRLRATDEVGNEGKTEVEVIVDTTPPSSPTGLAHAITKKPALELTWNNNPEPDIAGYAVYRGGKRLTPDLLKDTRYIDNEVKEGKYYYTVTAFDHAGWESSPSDGLTATIDFSPPTHFINVPRKDMRVGGLVDIKGTAYSQDDFKEYRLSLGLGKAPTQWQLLRSSPVPVKIDVLGQWNTFGLTEDAVYSLKLEAEDINHNIGTSQLSITIDNRPPAKPTGLVALLNGTEVQLNWDANIEPDLLGYFVYRNDRLANASGAIVGDLSPYIIKTNAYLDSHLADGIYHYTVAAVDSSGNNSDLSESAIIEIETRPPHAIIIQPETKSRFEEPVYVVATSEDQDIKQVVFNYRPAGNGTWLMLGAADFEPPYAIIFAPATLGLAYGDYELQAVATDTHNNIDPTPMAITVQYGDTTRPQAVTQVQTQVNGGEVTISWQANSDADLAGYHITRADHANPENKVRITTTPVIGTVYKHSNVADGYYDYHIIAVDTHKNEADASEPALAMVYTPTLQQPFTPVLAETTTLIGHGYTQAAVNGELQNTAGRIPLATTMTDAAGLFTLANIALSSGVNTITLQLTDTHGNRSKTATISVKRGQQPSQPTGLTATLNNGLPHLTWNKNPESNIVGYRMFRNGTTFHPLTQTTNITATASDNNTQAPRAIDKNPNSTWSAGTTPVGDWLELKWNTAQLVSEINVSWYYQVSTKKSYYATAYDIEAWSGQAWVNIMTVTNNAEINNVITFPQPYLTTRIRVVVQGTQDETVLNSVQLAEITVHHLPIIPVTVLDFQEVNGLHQYTITAVNQDGFSSEPSAPASLALGDVEPPEPVVLTASATGSDVTLNWTASASLDVIAYQVYKNGLLLATHQDLTQLIYKDIGLLNGTYVYMVKAVDAVGNVSQPSNGETITIALTQLPSPLDLQVTPIAAGKALQLHWSPPNGIEESQIYSYQIQRASQSGGPYQRVANLIRDNAPPPTDYLDNGLTNGQIYFYQVLALDNVLNEGFQSNEASGIPGDSVAPDAPLLYYPTQAGIPLTVYNPSVTLAGTAEADARVMVYQDNQQIAQTKASFQLQMQTTQIQSDLDVSPTLSADGHFGLYSNSNKIYLYDVQANEHNILLVAGDQAIWFDKGKQFIFINTGVIHIYDLDTGTVKTIIQPNDESILVARPSLDGQALIVLGVNKELKNKTWWVDLAANTWTPLTEIALSDFGTLSWSNDGVHLAYIKKVGSFSSVMLINTQTNTIQTIYAHSGFDSLPTPHWSPDGKQLLYRATKDGQQQIWRYRLDDGSNTLVKTLHSADYPQWSPDGQKILYFTTETPSPSLMLLDLDSLKTIPLLEDVAANIKQLQWHSNGYLSILSTQNQLQLITPPGHFAVPNAQLQTGKNLFTAIAVDEAGNRSSTAQPIQVTLLANSGIDLSLTNGLSFLPTLPLSGEAAKIAVQIRNVGQDPAPTSTVSLTVVDPAGHNQQLLQSKIVKPLAAGASETVVADWKPIGVGNHTVIAVVDVDNQINETNETNNILVQQLIVPEAGKPLLDASTNTNTYANNTPVLANVILLNASDRLNGRLEVLIEDAYGLPTATLVNQVITDLPYATKLQLTPQWNTTNTFAGQYQLHARLTDLTNRVLSERFVPFQIESYNQIATAVTTNRLRYPDNTPVHITGRVNFIGGNHIFHGAMAHFLIMDQNGLIVDDDVQALGALLPGDSAQLSMTWNTAQHPVGLYRVELLVIQNGQTIQQATTELMISEGEIQFSGGLQLAVDAPAVGVPQIATYTVRNTGNVPIRQLPVQIVLLNGQQKILKQYDFQHDLAITEEKQQIVIINTDELVLGHYQVVLQAVVPQIVNGLAEGETVITLDRHSFELTDRTPPLVTIQSPSTNEFVRHQDNAIIQAFDALSQVEQVAVSLDGATWQPAFPHDLAQGLYALALTSLGEGIHTLQAVATDQLGNMSTTPMLPFLVDNTPPVIRITGVAQNGRYAQAVTPYIEIEETHLDRYFISLNSLPFVSGTLIEALGVYTLNVVAIDLANNRSEQTLIFGLGQTGEIKITGVADGGEYTATVIPAFEFIDIAEDTIRITLNNLPFNIGDRITDDGYYTLSVEATDNFNNPLHQTLQFVLDQTAPTLTILEPADHSVKRGALEVRLIASDNIDLDQVAVSTDGVNWLPAHLLDSVQALYGLVLNGLGDGDYHLQAHAADKLGNTTTVQNPVTLDSQAPVIQISGVSQGVQYSQAVTPIIQVEDAHLIQTQITLNGLAFVSGTAIAQTGHYLLAVTTLDQAGNQSGQSLEFDLLSHAQIIITGVTPGSDYATAITPLIQFINTKAGTDYITLNDTAFISGTSIAADGYYTLIASAQDEFQQPLSATLQFSIDQTPPTISISQPTPESVWSGHVDVILMAQDNRRIQQVDIQLDQVAWQSTVLQSDGYYHTQLTFLAEGSHQLLAQATDHVGHRRQNNLSFSIDNTPPQITIQGVDDQGRYNTRVTPFIEVQDAHPATSQVMLNDKIYVSGTPITQPGQYRLQVDATDQAGNQAQIHHQFELVDTAHITITGIDEGGHYATAITPVVQFVDTVPGSERILLNDQAFSSGTPIQQDGDYTLQASAQNHFQNTLSEQRQFSLDQTPPSLVIVSPAAESVVRGDRPAILQAHDNLKLGQVSIQLNQGNWLAALLVDPSLGQYQASLNQPTEGDHWIQALAQDETGNQTQQGHRFTVDNTPPLINITGVTEQGRYQTVVTPVIIIHDKYLAQTTISLNGEAFTSGTPINLPGDYTLVVTATDQAANQSSESRHFSWLEPALIRIQGVQSHAIYNRDVTPVVEFIRTVPGSEQLTLNQQPFSLGTTITAEGHHQLQATAQDYAGQTISEQISFTLDKTAPLLSIDTPHMNQVTAQLSVDIQGRSEAQANVFFIDAQQIQRSVLADNQGQFNFNAIPLQPDINAWRFYALDLAGNQSTDLLWSIIVDTQPPIVTIISPPDNSHIMQTTFDIQGESEAHATVHLQLSNGDSQTTVVDQTGHFEFTTVPLHSGENLFQFYAVDLAGNQGPTATLHIQQLTQAKPIPLNWIWQLSLLLGLIGLFYRQREQA